jgi:hypothetical protein
MNQGEAESNRRMKKKYTRNFIISTLHEIIPGRSKQVGSDKRDMQHAW